MDAPTPERPLAGHWTVVTGGSAGIGYGIAEAFVAAGAHVLIAARTAEALDRAAGELRRSTVSDQVVETVVTDVGERASTDALMDRVAELPALTTYVANAGAGAIIPFLDITDEEWDRTVGLNLTGTFRTVRGAARLMVERPAENQSILVTSSIRGTGVRPGTAAYAATKAGITQMARVAAYELAPHGIRVNVLAPGITATPMAAERNPERFAEMTRTVPLGRAGTPADVGAAAVYLAAGTAGYVTGAVLPIDGGEDLW